MMSESVDVFKEKLIESISDLMERNPPKTADGEMYIKHLINRIETGESISASEIIEYLACAGYSVRDILKIFYDVGLITTDEDWVRYRDAVRRVMLSGGCEEQWQFPSTS